MFIADLDPYATLLVKICFLIIDKIVLIFLPTPQFITLKISGVHMFLL